VFASPELGDVALPTSLEAAERARVELAFRPHAVLIGTAGSGDSLEMNGVIEGGEFLGEFMRYEIRVNDAIVIADQPHLRGMQRIARGSVVRLAVHPREVRLIA
jgi:iron(III) transport system ATP-binding protein